LWEAWRVTILELTFPDINPVAIALGPVKIHWYAIMYLLAFAMAYGLMRLRLRHQPFASITKPSKWVPSDIEDLLLYGIAGVLLGGRLGYVLFYQPGYYWTHPVDIIRVWDGGMSFHGGAVGVILAMVIFGGTVRLVKVTQVLVPLLAFGYLGLALAVIGINYAQIPSAISLIVRSAFGMEPLLAGIAGAAVAWGVRRAVFASSNGLGEATFSAAGARTSHPGKQGLVQTFSVYIDILLICMASGLMMVVSGKFNVTNPDGGFFIENLPGVAVGPNWVQESINTLAPGWGPAFVAVAVLMFGFACLLAYFYVANTNLLYLLDGRKGKGLKLGLKLGTMAIVFTGSIISADFVWAVGDIGLGLIAWVNLFCLVFLFKIVRTVWKDYEEQARAGLDPHFDPVKLGIKNADFWLVKHDWGSRQESESNENQPKPTTN